MTEPEKPHFTAYADESIRTTAAGTMYILCAYIERAADAVVLNKLIELKPKGAVKLHWREMGRKAQAKSLSLIGSLSGQLMIVSAIPAATNNPERARRKCLEVLLPLLEAAGVEMLILESRNDKQDKYDREMVINIRRKQLISRIRIEHKRGQEEPRLWIPDQVAGAYGSLKTNRTIASDWKRAWRSVEKKLESRTIVP